MAAGPSPDLIRWAEEHAVRLNTLDPAADLDDLEPLVDLIGDARVVAIGEPSHGIREFFLLRHRILRFLVERMGFTTYGMESAFTEGLLVDEYICGGPGDPVEIARDGITFTMGLNPEMVNQVAWLRAHNDTAATPVRFFGIDVPSSAASLVPAIDAIAAYLATLDPRASSSLAPIRAIAQRFSDVIGWPSMVKYGQLLVPDRDALTAALSQLAARFTAAKLTYLELSSSEEFQVAQQHLRLARALDHVFRESVAGQEATGESERGFGPMEVNHRDAAMAETVRWLLERDPTRRLVLSAHNQHIRRTMARLSPTSPPMSMCGHHLAAELGSDYVAIGVTCGHGQAVNVVPDAEDGELGEVKAVPVELGPVKEGSIDHLLEQTGLGLLAIDLRAAKTDPTAAGLNTIDSMRAMDFYVGGVVADAFDMVVHVPRTHAARFLVPPDREIARIFDKSLVDG